MVANYRASSRAKSQAGFSAKTSTLKEYIDETIHSMELLIESSLIQKDHASNLLNRANQFAGITAS
jgi:hypothetical protein